MTKVIFIEPDGREHCIDASNGSSLMDEAINNMVPGILGECGGACICATCHIIAAPDWSDKLPPSNDIEKAMLEGALGVTAASRLCCQITIDDSLEGLTVHIPEQQL